MGNCPSCYPCEVNFEFQKGNETNKIVLSKKVDEKEERKIIFENVKFEEGIEQFIDIINTIYKKIEILEDDNKIFLKKSMKSTLSKILDEKSVNKYLEEIDKFLSYDQDLDTIIKIKEIFNLFYYKRKDIGKDQLNCLITNLSDILKDSKKLKDTYIECFKKHLEKIYLKDLQKIRIINKTKTVRIKKLKNNNDINNIEKEYEKTEEKENPNILVSRIEDVDKILEKNNQNNFSKYSENSKHQVEKLEGENKKLKYKRIGKK